jgi:hypothetical protein
MCSQDGTKTNANTLETVAYKYINVFMIYIPNSDFYAIKKGVRRFSLPPELFINFETSPN